MGRFIQYMFLPLNLLLASCGPNPLISPTSPVDKESKLTRIEFYVEPGMAPNPDQANTLIVDFSSPGSSRIEIRPDGTTPTRSCLVTVTPSEIHQLMILVESANPYQVPPGRICFDGGAEHLRIFHELQSVDYMFAETSCASSGNVVVSSPNLRDLLDQIKNRVTCRPIL